MKANRTLLIILIVTLIIGAGVLAWIKFDKSKVKDNSVAENLSREVEKDTAVIGLRYLSAEKLYPENEGQFSAINFNYNLFEGLASFDRENRIVPVLAKSWDNPNNSTWRFHINQEAKFSNGAPVTANDVKFTYDYVNENQDFEMSQAMPPAEVKVIDDYTVEFITKKPDPLLLNKLALYLMVLSENEVKANGVKNHIGSGPYIFASRDENTVTLIRNENYWREKAKVKTAIFKVIPDEKDRVEALLRGEIDFTSYGFTSKEAKDLAEQAISENKVQKKQVLDQSVTYLSIDVDRDKSPYVDTTPNPLKNLKVRQAMYEAINVEDIANQALFKIVGASQLVSSGIFGYNPSIKRPAFDLEHAKSLMKEAGYENGFGFSLDYTDSPGAKELHQPLVDLLARINIKVTLQPVDPNKFFARVMKRDSSACILSWSTDSLDASEILENLYHTQDDHYGSSNASGYSNPVLDKQIEEISTIMDPKVRLDKVQSALKIATEDLPAIPLHQVYSQWAISQDLSWTPRLDTAVLIYEMAGKVN